MDAHAPSDKSPTLKARNRKALLILGIGDKGQSSGLFINGKKEHKNFYLSGGTIKLQCINVILDRQQTRKGSSRQRWCFFWCRKYSNLCASVLYFLSQKMLTKKVSFFVCKKIAHFIPVVSSLHFCGAPTISDSFLSLSTIVSFFLKKSPHYNTSL